MFKTTLLIAALGFGTTAMAQEFTYHTTNDAFADVAFAIENAIISKGLVIDSISHTGEMLERTRMDVGSDKVLFLAADVYEFCSAAVSRQVMEADPLNINYCPYAIRVYEQPETAGTVTVSHQAFSGTMEPVNTLLEDIVKDALGLE